MKSLAKLSILSAVLAACGSFAMASPILLTGGLTIVGNDKTDDTFNTTSISFSTPAGIPPSNTLITGTSGNLSFATGQTGIMSAFTSTSTNTNIFTVNDAQGLSFELFSVAIWTDSYTAGLGTSLTIKGFGEFLDAVGDTPAAGTFILTSSDTSCGGTSCGSPDDIGFNFTPSASPSAIAPEPSSLLLLGTGLIGGAGMLLRRYRTVY